jgi:CubicO group peptidase (beta-lactamase class C family)
MSAETTAPAPLDGEAAPGWEGVREAFAANLADGFELGASCAVYHRGRKVVDVWGGWADKARTIPYGHDAMQLVFSTSKGVAAILLAQLVERGQVDPDAPLAEYWPEFAAAGKGAVTVGQAVSHQAGLASVDRPLSLEEALAWDPVVEALAAQAPLWELGTGHGYHALTYGWIVGELLRRVTGHRPGELLAAEASHPLDLDLWFGLPAEEEPRVVPLVGAEPPSDPEVLKVMLAVMGPGTLGGRALSLDGTFGNVWNRRDVHAAELLAAGAIGDARSLARLYAACIGEVDGVRLLRPETVDRVRAVRSDGPDKCLVVPTRFGLGFMLPSEFEPMGGEGSFGHPGAGGSVAWALPEADLAVAYVMNRMGAGLAADPRPARLSAAALAAASA